MYYSLELEQCILVLFFLKKIKILFKINCKDFYFKNHQIIYKILMNFFYDYKEFNIKNIKIHFYKNNIKYLFKYLIFISQNTYNSSNVNFYIKLLIYLSFLRKLIKKLSKIKKSSNYDEFFLFLESNIIKIKNLEEYNSELKLIGFLLDNFLNFKYKLNIIKTGFFDLDKLLYGLHKGELIIIAGRPSMGKTAFSLNIALNIVFKNNLPVLMFSVEMPAVQLIIRILSFFMDLDQNILRSGDLNCKENELLKLIIKKIYFSKFFLDESSNLNINIIYSKSLKIIKKFGNLSLIIIDYLQLMDNIEFLKNRVSEISEISKSLKCLAKDLNVPIIAISQLNRSLEMRINKKPLISDLRESGSIEQDADVILFIYREEIYDKNNLIKGKTEIIIGKQRNGPTGNIILNFSCKNLKFN